MKEHMIVAIDGYSSCGKSTLAKTLATELHYTYIDSGAMYRAVTYYFLKNNIDLENPGEIKKALEEIHLNFKKQQIELNGENIADEIRQMYISSNVSEVSALKPVREAMVALQQKMSKKGHVVMDGRDIGTTVFPHAQLKIFMTADPEIRAQRRFRELLLKGVKVSYQEVYDNLTQRDKQDTTRTESPLKMASDAIILDNSHLNEEEQLDFVHHIIIDNHIQL